MRIRINITLKNYSIGILVFIVPLLVTSNFAKAGNIKNDSFERKHIITAFPSNLIVSTLKLGYESNFEASKSLKFMLSIGAGGENTPSYNVNSFFEYSGELQLRFYLSKFQSTLNGLYMAPFVFYKSMNFNAPYLQIYPNQDFNSSDLFFGYIMGLQHTFPSNFTLEIFFGGGENITSGYTYPIGGNPYGYYKGVGIHSGIGIGTTF